MFLCVDLECVLCIETGRVRYGRERRERHGWTPGIKGRRPIITAFVSLFLVYLLSERVLSQYVISVCASHRETKGKQESKDYRDPWYVFYPLKSFC